jgi:hypothetical protein
MHTQGEWFLVTVNGGDDNDEIATIVDGCTVSIAAVFGPCSYSEGRPNDEPEPHYEVGAEESKANGQLLTGAACMFAALESIALGHANGASFSGTDCAEIAAAALAKVRAG